MKKPKKKKEKKGEKRRKRERERRNETLQDKYLGVCSKIHAVNALAFSSIVLQRTIIEGHTKSGWH